MIKIFLDPGHGGRDPGAVGHGLQEKNITLQIAKRIEALLKGEYSGVQVKLSRTGDQTVSLKQRTDAANAWGADYYISVHVNAGGGTGYEDYIYSGSVPTRTRTYRDVMHAEITKQLGMRNRGKKRANFHVLRETRMPAFLSENGFIDHAADARALKDHAFIEKIARGHVNGIARIFNLKKKAPAPPKQPPSSGTGYYRVQVGAFKEKANAERLAAKLKKQGYDTYVRRD